MSEYDFILQMNLFIASDEIVSATHLQIRIVLQTNMFITRDDRVLCWGQTLFVLKINTLALEMNELKIRIRVSVTHKQTHTELAIYQQLPSRIYVEMIAIYTATYL